MAQMGLGNDFDIIPLVIPIDLDTSQGGDQFSLENCSGVGLLFITGVGAAGRDLTFTLTRHVDMADTSGTTIDLSAIAHPYYYYKQGSTATVVGVGTWSRAALSDTDGATVVLDAAEGETSSLIYIHLDAADLGSGYSSLSVSAVVAGGSGAKLGAAVAILEGLNVRRIPTNLATALA